MVEFQLEVVFLVMFILIMGRKPNVVFFIFGTINGKNGTLKGGKTKNGGTSDDNDNARVTLRLA